MQPHVRALHSAVVVVVVVVQHWVERIGLAARLRRPNAMLCVHPRLFAPKTLLKERRQQVERKHKSRNIDQTTIKPKKAKENEAATRHPICILTYFCCFIGVRFFHHLWGARSDCVFDADHFFCWK